MRASGPTVSRGEAVGSEEAVGEARRPARGRGPFVGPSSGANLVVARRVRGSCPGLGTVVMLFCDGGRSAQASASPQKMLCG